MDIMRSNSVSKDNSLKLEELRRHELSMQLASRETAVTVDTGDSTSIGNIENSSGVAVGRESSSKVETSKNEPQISVKGDYIQGDKHGQ